MGAILKIDIIADASKAAATLGRAGDAAGRAGDQAEKSGSKWKSFGKAAAVAVGAAALGGVVAMFKTGIGEQKDFLSGQAQLANGIKTTGNAAHVSVGSLEDLASSIQNYSGQTDDSIVASEKLLLTFTNVRNEAGKGNDVFTQATKITADMAAKMGGDASKYAVQLGKALNDPVKGITALTRVGVTFTAAQKKSIKSMQDSGDTLGAQKVIMAELRKEFGGSAKAAGDTLPGQMEKAKRSFEDVSQSVVASFMPVLTVLANILTHTLLPAFQATIGWMTSHKGAVVAFAVAIGAVYTAIKVGQASAALGEAGGLVAWIKQTNIAAGATRIWAGIQAVFNAIMAANPIVLIIIALVALGVALVVLYKKSATFRKIVQSAFKAVTIAGKALWNALKTAFRGIVAAAKVVWSALKTGFNALVTAVKFVAKLLYYWYVWPWKTAYTAVLRAVRAVINWLPGAWRSIVSGIKTGLSTVATVLYGPFKTAWGWIKKYVISPIKNAWDAIAGAVRRGLSGVAAAIYAPFKTAWGWISKYVVGPIKRAFTGTANAVTRALSEVASAIYAPFKAAWGWISKYVVSPVKDAFTGAAHAITNAMSGVASAITAPFKAAWDWIKKYVVGPIKSVWNTIADGINAIHFSIKIPKGIPFIGGKGWTFDPPNVPRLASGGIVDSATLAVVGEAGREIVAPDDMLRRLIREELGNAGINIVVNGALDPDAVARQINSILTKHNRRNAGVRRSGVATAI